MQCSFWLPQLIYLNEKYNIFFKKVGGGHQIIPYDLHVYELIWFRWQILVVTKILPIYAMVIFVIPIDFGRNVDKLWGVVGVESQMSNRNAHNILPFLTF